MNLPNPAIVAQAAVRRLPRAAIWLFCLAYVLPGFLGREPWKNEDVSAFGAMLGMARAEVDWLNPQILGRSLDDLALLPYWLGALAIQVFPFLSPELASRIPFAALLGLTLASTWYGVYHLARLPLAQPLSFAFGGEASPTDYARTLADAALLALLACLGLAQLSHEATPDVARLGFTSLLLYATARLAANGGQRPVRTLVPLLLSLAGLAFSAAPWYALGLTLGSLLLLIWAGKQRMGWSDPGETSSPWPADWVWWCVALSLLICVPLGLWLPNQRLVLPTDAEDWRNFGELILWFSWPAWPLAAWTLWRWRAQWLSPHVALPLWFVGATVMASAWHDGSDRVLLSALPAFACLAAFALPTLRRSVSALIDWFTLLFFTGCAVVIWVIYVAMMTGVPAKPAANVAKLAPGFVPEFSWLLLVPALLATAGWIWLLAWRVGRHRTAIWKSLVLPAGGATLCWLLLMTLWLPLLDHARSYGPIARRIASLTPDAPCVVVHGLSTAQVVGLQYHGGMKLTRDVDDPRGCGALLVTPEAMRRLSELGAVDQWSFQATVPRLTDRRETLLLYRRQP